VSPPNGTVWGLSVPTWWVEPGVCERAVWGTVVVSEENCGLAVVVVVVVVVVVIVVVVIWTSVTFIVKPREVGLGAMENKRTFMKC